MSTENSESTTIVWTDIREDKTQVSVVHQRAELNGFVATVYAGGRMASYEADADGEFTSHKTCELAKNAAEKRLRRAAARPPSDRVLARIDFVLRLPTPVRRLTGPFAPEQKDEAAALQRFLDAVGEAAKVHLGAGSVNVHDASYSFSLMQEKR